MLRCFCLLVFFISLAKARDVCYGELGCFTTDEPFYDPIHRPIQILPDPPEKVATEFHLYTRNTLLRDDGSDLYDALDYENKATVDNSDFDHVSRKTTFITHGYLEDTSLRTFWMQDMLRELLVQEDLNVILVDWGKGSLTGYPQAVGNTQLVGAQISLITIRLYEWYGMHPKDIHVIGFSLGAQIAGYAGERMKEHSIGQIGRITALDAAGPYFENTDPKVRIDPTDAEFIDAIHCDTDPLISLGFGISMPVGHVDFYPNGGHDQPSCSGMGLWDHIDQQDGIIEGISYFVACNHLRCPEYYNRTINSEFVFQGYPCADENTFENTGSCMNCVSHPDGCGVMGYHATQNIPNNVETVYYLDTDSKWPYDYYSFGVEVHIGDDPNAEEMPGNLYIALFGENGQTDWHKLTDHTFDINTNDVYSFKYNSELDLGNLFQIYFKYEHDWDVLDPGSWDLFPAIYLEKVLVVSGDNQKTYEFCDDYPNLKVADESTYVLASKEVGSCSI